jgi:flagellar basal body-associated protein FliL
MADVEKEPEGTSSLEEGGKPKKRGGLLLYLIGFPVLAAAAFAFVLFVLKPFFPPLEAQQEVKAAFRKIVPLEAVIVNLAGTEGRRYLKAKVELEVPGGEKVVREVEERKPHLRDLLIDLLSRKHLEEVAEASGRDLLRREILERFSEELGDGKVRRILLTEFVIQ